MWWHDRRCPSCGAPNRWKIYWDPYCIKQREMYSTSWHVDRFSPCDLLGCQNRHQWRHFRSRDSCYSCGSSPKKFCTITPATIGVKQQVCLENHVIILVNNRGNIMPARRFVIKKTVKGSKDLMSYWWSLKLVMASVFLAREAINQHFNQLEITSHHITPTNWPSLLLLWMTTICCLL